VSLRRFCSIGALGAYLVGGLHGQSTQRIPLDTAEKLDLGSLRAEVVIYRGRRAVFITNPQARDSDYGEGLAIVRGASFKDGTIKVTLSGNTAPDASPELRGFVGIAFRLIDRAHFELIYIRPRNGRSEDQLQRNHTTQYMSMPGFSWDKLRSETPGKYESYVDLVPGLWTNLKIEVKGTTAKLYVNGADQPALIVNDLKQPVSKGGIALWVGKGTIAHFAGLKIEP
jgi:hypothetical protein